MSKESKEIQKDEPKIIDEMKPLKDYLQGKSTTHEFIDECRNIHKTETAEFEVLPLKPLPDNNRMESTKSE